MAKFVKRRVAAPGNAHLADALQPGEHKPETTSGGAMTRLTRG
ncbi:MAG TPA: hypothetical protein VMX97_07115 [Hyphomicrobiaceae bacterium]|nr:hypothetical protein [Hyphomicrobiaceae bacterium]